MFTQRAALLCFVAFCFYLIAVVNSLPSFYYVLMWLALGLLAASLGIAFLSLSGLDFSWNLARSTGHASGPNASEIDARELAAPIVEATLRNRGSLNKTGILIELYLRDLGDQKEVALVYLLEAVPAGKTLDIALPLRELPRGIYKLERARLVGSDVLGLFRARRTLSWRESNAEIIVAPALLPVAALSPLGRGGRARRGTSRRVRPGAGDELRGTRPYVAGDDMRQIHWKSTARTGALVMREWEQIGGASTMVIWDGARETEWGAPNLDSTECGLILVASLLATFSEQSLPCSLALLGEHAQFCPDALGQSAPASALSRDQTQALARARAGRTMPLGAALDGVWRGAREIETLTLVTASLAPDTIELVRSLRAKNIGVRVLLVDGAALGRASGDTRFSKRRARGNPPLQNVADNAPIPVTSEEFARQKAALSHAGARVALFAPQSATEIWPALQRAQIVALEDAPAQANAAVAGAVAGAEPSAKTL